MSTILRGSFTRRLGAFFAIIFAMVIFGAPAYAGGSQSLVIKRIYGGGGASSTTKLKYDYIELFNAGPVVVNLANFTIQYSGGTSAKGFTTASSIALPDFMLQPGQYFLIQGFSAGQYGADLAITPDYIPTVSLSGGAVPDLSTSNGKVAIVYGSALLPNCSTTTNYAAPPVDPPPSSPNLIDFVGYGNATNGSTIVANCAEGTYPADNISGSRVLERKLSCGGDTDVNVNDFTTVTTNNAQPAHNSSSPLEPCFGDGTVMPVLSGSMTPSVVSPGGTSLMAISVTPGSNPVSQSQTITADLSAFGGSTAEPLYDDGTHGDAVAGDSVFSLSVTAGPTVGTYTFPVTYIDDAFRQVNLNVSLEVAGGIPQTTAIHDIQSSVPSTYVGQTVNVDGIVVGITANGFYVEAKNSAADFRPETPEGIFVSVSPLPTQVAIGNEVIVSGKVMNGYANYLGDSVSVLLLSTGNTVPTSILVHASDINLQGSLDQLRYLEGMRVKFDSLTVVSPTEGSIDQVNAVGSGSGKFYAVITGLARPFREPGVSVADILPPDAPGNVPRFDGNPERLYIDTAAQSGTPINITSNTELTGVYGIFEISSGVPTVLLDPTQAIGVSQQMSAQPALLPAGNEVMVAGASLGNLFNSASDGNSAPTTSASGYTARLKKVSLAVRTLLNLPDVIAVAQVENAQTLQDVAQQVNADSVTSGLPDPQYQAYLQPATGQNVNIGFLVKSSRINATAFDVFGQSATFTDPGSGTQKTLFDLPPVVLHAGVKRQDSSDYPLTIIANALLPMDNIGGTEGPTIRAQREKQAEYVAELIQSFQSAGESVVTVGGFNAYEVNDGYVDVLNAIKGTPASADQDVLASPAGLVSPALVNLGDGVSPTQRYSAIENGTAAAVDHILVTSNLAAGARFQYMHSNSDFPVSLYGDPNRPEGISDHDMVIAYFTVPGNVGVPNVSLTATVLDFGNRPLNATAQLTATLTNNGTAPLLISSINVDLPDFVQSNDCGLSLAAGASCTITVSFTPLELKQYCGTLTINDNLAASPQTISVVGTGINAVVPVANNLAVVTAMNTPVETTLTASNPNQGTLTYTVVANPQHGTLSGTAPNLTYTPASNYSGADNFTFKVNDGTSDSNVATVSITMNPAAPIATDQSVSVSYNTAQAITLTATGTGTLTYTVVTQPAHGTLSGTAPALMYTPASNYVGTDSFTFKAADSNSQESNTATVSITVLPAAAPVAADQAVTVAYNTGKPITLNATGAGTLTYTVVTQPAHGTLSGTAPALTYTPVSSYAGPDSFTFKVNDGTSDSNVATVSITVTPAAPVAADQGVTVSYNTAKAITLGATGSGTLTYTVLAQPAHGTLSGTAPALTYTPASNYTGADSFTFKATDGIGQDSNTASVTIAVLSGVPVAADQSVSVSYNVAKAITLSATGTGTLTYTVVAQPAHGTLSGTAPALTYTPASNYTGADSFTFKATDSNNQQSNTATVTIAVAGDLTWSPLSGMPTSSTVIAGQTAAYSLQVAGWTGASGTVTFTCAGAPSLTTCSVSPSSATLNGTNAIPVTVTIRTTGSTTAGLMATPGTGGLPTGLTLTLAGVLTMLIFLARTRKVQWRAVAACAAVLVTITLSSCGGGGSGSQSGPTNKTPTGSYTVTVTATAGSVSKDVSLTLNVQ